MKKNILSTALLLGVLSFTGVTSVHAATAEEIMKKISPNLKTATIKSVAPTSQNESDFLLSGYLGKYAGTDNYMIYGYCDGPTFDDCKINLQSDDYEGRWDPDLGKEVAIKGEFVTYNIKVTYEVPKNNLDTIKNYLSKVNTADMSNSSTWIQIEDLSLINYYKTSSKSELWNLGASGRALKYSQELNNITEGTGVEFYLDVRAGNQDETLMFESAFGPMTIFYNNYAYGFTENGIYLKRVIYIPESTADTKEAYIAAAQARINKYLGNDSDVTITYGGLISSLTDAEDSENPVISDGNYYNVKVSGKTYKFYIIKGSADKLVEPTYNGKDIETDIVITSSNSSIPLDTNVDVTRLESDDLKKALGTDNYESYDITLFSNASNKNITKLENGKFLVSIPVSNKFEGKTLVAIYVKEDGTKEEHTVEVKDGLAKFETDHFSTYSLVELINEENPNTVDGIIFYVGLGMISIIGLASTVLYIKKKFN